jgi:hypothetical protein
MHDVLKQYQSYLGEVPEFLNKYLTLDIMKRLKDISFFCGMDRASKHVYDFKFYISRYDHSLNVALITWKLTQDKTATLAALFHDISTPVFSHVIDFMNGDLINQESTEEKTDEILSSSNKLKDYLEIDGVSIEEVIDFKRHTAVDLERPHLCADRLDGTILTGLSWGDLLTLEEAKKVIDSTVLALNANGQDEIAVTNQEAYKILIKTNDEQNELVHKDIYMMELLASIVKSCISLGIVDYESLYHITEKEMFEIIEDNLDLDVKLREKYYIYQHIERLPLVNKEIKEKKLNPLVVNDEKIKIYDMSV